MWYFAFAMWFAGLVLTSVIVHHANDHKENSWFGDRYGFNDDHVGIMFVYWILSPIAIPSTLLALSLLYLTKFIYKPFRKKE